MDTRVDPRDADDLNWYFNEAEAAMKRLPSLHEALERRTVFEKISRPKELRGGQVFVGSGTISRRYSDPYDSVALFLAAKERRIRLALEGAGQTAAMVLRLRFREVLTRARIPFGLEGLAGRRGGRALSLMAVRQTALRGTGALAHLTAAARAAHAQHVLNGGMQELLAWVDQLGTKLASGRATEPQRMLCRAISREAEQLVLAAWRRYRLASVRVPERVRTMARLRATG